MGIEAHPAVGAIVRVDLNEGFRVPEMRKRRPAIVISPELQDRKQLCTIVPLSTTAPRIPYPFVYELHLEPPLPFPYMAPTMWVKADMVQTVAFHRLSYLQLQERDENGNRQYDFRAVDEEVLEEIRDCVRAALGI